MTDLAHIRQLLLTQDNAGTSDPVFVVERKVREYGYDGDYHDATACWVNSEMELTLSKGVDESNEYRLKFEHIEHRHSVSGAPEGWTRTHYVDRWEYVQPFLTREGAEAFIADNKHNLGECRVYVGSAHGNPEWKAVRALLMAKPLSEKLSELHKGIAAEATRTWDFAMAMNAIAYGQAANMAREAGL